MSRTATKTYRKYSWHNIKKDFVKNWPLLLMVAPALAFYIIFHYIPMGGLLMAFENYKPNLGLLGSKFVGMKNFVDFFSSVYCWRVIRNTLILSLLQIGIEFPFTICFAILLNEITRSSMLRRWPASIRLFTKRRKSMVPTVSNGSFMLPFPALPIRS